MTPRMRMLEQVVRFVSAAQRLDGVKRIALIGSILMPKPVPKDVDLLVTVSDAANLAPLAACARQIQGRLQGCSLWADVFLDDERHEYLGRTCIWRRCEPGIRRCNALHCARRPHLFDDLQVLTIPAGITQSPPLELWPAVVRRAAVPADVEVMLAKLG